MKSVSTVASAISILALVGIAISFTGRRISLGDVYCVPRTVTPIKDQPCYLQIPLDGDAQTYDFVPSGGTLISPCTNLFWTVTYLDTGTGCILAEDGTEYLLTVDE